MNVFFSDDFVSILEEDDILSTLIVMACNKDVTGHNDRLDVLLYAFNNEDCERFARVLMHKDIPKEINIRVDYCEDSSGLISMKKRFNNMYIGNNVIGRPDLFNPIILRDIASLRHFNKRPCISGISAKTMEYVQEAFDGLRLQESYEMGKNAGYTQKNESISESAARRMFESFKNGRDNNGLAGSSV